MESTENQARGHMQALVQTSIGQFALGLVCLDLLFLILHRGRISGAELRSFSQLGFAGGGLLLFMVFWLRVPRPPWALNLASGLAALLTTAAALLLFGTPGDREDMIYLMLIQVGAGYFLLSSWWFGLLSLFLLGGLAQLNVDPSMAGPSMACGVAFLLGLLLHVNRRNLIQEMLELRAREINRELEMESAMAQIKTLRGLVPICSYCKKIRDDIGTWQSMESFVEAHSEAVFSHGICPICAEKLKAEWEASLKMTTVTH